MSVELQDDQMCFVCGKKNPQGLCLEFGHPKKGILTTDLIFTKVHQGYRNIVHGGMIATILDEVMVNLAWKEGRPVVTAEITVRLKKPTYVGQRVFFEGRIVREKARLVYASATAKNEKGEILASAKALCVPIRLAAKNIESKKAGK